ncbi:MAG: mechanosensitive ion channel family protein [Gammaproteobacteria bacterium]|nr:mechanosensitive ion channel family protein [Gammaproteobacteria bacterium]
MPDSIIIYIPVVSSLLASALFLWLMHWLLLGRRAALGAQARLPRQLIMFALTISALVLLIILFPMHDSTRGQVITLLGLVITGVIALSSTSFVANVMAGLMLHVVKSFNPGDFIRVGQQMGRVTERGLFHVEIQTEDRDLSTIPNLHLATNPVTVVHSTGTIISAELSLGYDISRKLIEDLLKQAALQTDLQDPFVLIISLGDYSVVYRISGFLAEVKNLITARSNLKKNVLDALHENNVEIVSPAFMNQRQLPAEQKIIPDSEVAAKRKKLKKEILPEELIFDKAEVAAEAEDLRAQMVALSLQIEALKKSKKGLAEPAQKDIDSEIILAEKKQQAVSADLEKIKVDE